MILSELLLLFLASFFPAFSIKYSTAEWVERRLTIVNSKKCGADGLDGTLFPWTAAPSVTVCFENGLNPQNVGTLGMRKVGSRFWMRQKTSEKCQQCIDEGKCTKGIVWSELLFENWQEYVALILQGKRVDKILYLNMISFNEYSPTSDFRYRSYFAKGRYNFEIGPAKAEAGNGDHVTYTYNFAIGIPMDFSNGQGAFLDDYIGLWMLYPELLSNISPGQKHIKIFTKRNIVQKSTPMDILEFYANPYDLTCYLWSEESSRYFKACDFARKPPCYKAHFCYDASNDANISTAHTWIAAECARKAESSNRRNYAQWHGFGVRLCTDHTEEKIFLNATLEFTFSNISFTTGTGMLNYSLRKYDFEWWSPSQDEHKLFTLILANPLEVRIVKPSGTEATEYLTESVDLAAAVSVGGEPIFDKMILTKGASSLCDGAMTWWLNGNELYEQICYGEEPKTNRKILGYRAFDEGIKLLWQLIAKYRECFPKYQNENFTNLPTLPSVVIVRVNWHDFIGPMLIEDSDFVDGDILWTPARFIQTLDEMNNNCGLHRNYANNSTSSTPSENGL